MNYRVVCKHKTKGPWVLVHNDSTYKNYYCVKCSKKHQKQNTNTKN